MKCQCVLNLLHMVNAPWDSYRNLIPLVVLTGTGGAVEMWLDHEHSALMSGFSYL